jgi:hypothetical protein
MRDSISKELGGDAENAGKSAGGKITGAIKKMIAAAGIGAAIKSALNEGAELEQSIGGIETLYKENADIMKKYAAEAYKSAGMSANEYMQNVTSFSASLLQGLGGDTAKAAEVADMAMRDMSDNWNKFGSDAASVQNAYKGFAKQNYTMLDNLKLGMAAQDPKCRDCLQTHRRSQALNMTSTTSVMYMKLFTLYREK